jgi:hypothetical protein
MSVGITPVAPVTVLYCTHLHAHHLVVAHLDGVAGHHLAAAHGHAVDL